MARLETGMYVQVIKTGRIGMVEVKERSNVVVSFYDRDCILPDQEEYKANMLKVVELNEVKRSQLRALVRGELTVKELSGGSNLLPEYVEEDGEKYTLTAEDLLCGVEYLLDKSDQEIYAWLDAVIFLYGEEIGLETIYRQIMIQDGIQEKDYLAYISSNLENAYFMLGDGPEGIDITPLLKTAAEQLREYLNADGKIPAFMAGYVADQFDESSIDAQSEKTQQVFRECLDILCEKKDPKAIQKRGYCYYCGTKIYPNDWVKAKDAFLEYYALTGDASAANTLGYIYYYGRTNGGVPQYEEAFRYFSIGHAYGYFESTYKLADMFSHGYGVVKSPETAYRMYQSVYDENYKLIRMGDFACKFADAALRMGNCFRDGIGVEKDPREAYYYYLEADFAIRKRMDMGQYGDKVVFNAIQKAMKETRELFTDHRRSFSYAYPNWIGPVLSDHRTGCIRIRKGKDDVLSLKISTVKRADEYCAPEMLLTFPEADYCDLKDSFSVKTEKGSSFKILDGRDEILFDDVEYNWRTMETKLYHAGYLSGIICTELYKLTVPGKTTK